MTDKTARYSVLLMASLFSYFSSVNITRTPILLDEFAHVPAGVSHWELGRFTLYRENPPFVRLLTSLPVWLSGPGTDYSRAGTGHRSEWAVGRDFIYANKEICFSLFHRARIVVTMLAVACGMLIYWWSRQWAGSVPAVIAAALWFSDPSVLAHSAAATTDIGTATVCLYACYFFYNFLRKPSSGWLLLAGIGLGLAEASKFSMLVLYPAWLVLAGMYRSFRRHQSGDQTETGVAIYKKLLLILAISIATINVLYGFEGSFKPLGSFRFRSFALAGENVRTAFDPLRGNRFGATPLSVLPVPLPGNYVLGLDSQKWEEEVGLKNIAGGHLVRGGFWYGPLKTLAYKLPVGTIAYLLFAIVAATWAAFARRKRGSFEDVMVWTLALSIILLLCSQAGLNWPVRYALPAFPFLFMAIAGRLRHACERRVWHYLIMIPLLLNCHDIVAYRECAIAYGNAIAGGPEGAQRVFIGSNFDWGQDLFRLVEWWKSRPEPLPLAVSYYGVLSPAEAGLPLHGLPVELWAPTEAGGAASRTGSDDFFWAISSNVLHGLPCSIAIAGGVQIYGSLHSPILNPENACACVGHSIYVFRICGRGCRNHNGSHVTISRLSGCIREIHEGDEEGIGTTP